MPLLKRRHFLQFTGSIAAALSLSHCGVKQQSDRDKSNNSRGVQNTSRKLAMLVGINAYPASSQLPALRGCITDVELQRNLLIYRFGFNPKDILTLTDSQATRTNILEAFEEHLIKQAKPGDIVVFHYSGHGSRISDPDHDFPDGLNSTFVPVDSSRPVSGNTGATVQDIMGHTLFLLMAALQTENVTVVLDCCHSGGGKRGNLQVRAVAGGTQIQANSQEREYQQKWLKRLNLSPEEFIKQRKNGVAKGVVITATNRNQLAADCPFNGFHAGAFTYLLTQYLWQSAANESLSRAMPSVGRSTTRISFTLQTPEFEVKPNSKNQLQPVYFVNQSTSGGEAVITHIEGSSVELWLGGIDSSSLAAFNKDAIFAILDKENRTVGQVQLESRQGLVGRGKLLDTTLPIQAGAFCIEQVRGIYNNLNLRIGLDPSLGNDTAQAIAALNNLKRIEVLPLQKAQVHYILGRQKAENTLGLFSPGFDAIPGSFGLSGETVTDAVLRLKSKLKSLLAACIIKMMLNTDSSRLNVTASLSRIGKENQLIAEVFPTRGLKKVPSQSKGASGGAVVSPDATKLPLGTAVRLQITNNETRDLYISALVIDATGEMTVIFPYQWTAAEQAALLGAGQTIVIPSPGDGNFELRTQEPKGVTEVLIVASVTPLRKALKTLQTLARTRGQQNGPVTLNDPVEVMDDLLDDLGEGTRGSASASARGIVAAKSVNTAQLAAMSITFEVI